MLKVNYKGQMYEIDLNGQIQKELLEKDYNGNLYINIALVREIARQLGWSISEIKTSMEPMLQDKFGNNLIHTHCEARVYIPDAGLDSEGNPISKELHGVADDLYKVDGLSRSCFPNMARVQALAVKNALKRAFPFFEADYLQAEDLAERGLIDAKTAKELGSKDNQDKQQATAYQKLEFMIDLAEKKTDLVNVVDEIKKAYDNKQINGDEFKRLKDIYSTKYNSLGA